MNYPKASIIIPTLNNSKILRRVLHAMEKLEYPNDYEVIVINDGSKDDTAEMFQREFSRRKNFFIINLPNHMNVCKTRNAGIKKARYPIVVNMDHDCIPEPKWLKDLVSGFDSPRVGVVSSFGDFGGTSTAFRKNLLEKVGGYDEEYCYYREDTDLTFKIMDLGFEYKKVRARYKHEHKFKKPKGFIATIKYVLQRVNYHKNDVLLYKKHPKLAGEFLDVKFGFLVNPVKDFAAATNTWYKGGKLQAGSPRGIKFIENKSPAHALAIILLGIAYVLLVKFYRLLGSIKFGKLLL